MFKQFIGIVLIVGFIGTVGFSLAQDDGDDPNVIQADDVNLITVLTILTEHTGPITEIAFSPDGTSFVSGSLDGTFCVWNVGLPRQAAGEPRFCLSDYMAGVTVYAWSSTERNLAITDSTGLTVNIYRADRVVDEDEWEDFEPDYQFEADEATILSVDFLADDETLLIRDLFDTFTLFHIEDEDILESYEGLEVSVHPQDSQFAILNFDGEIMLIEGDTGDVDDTIPTLNATHLQYSPGGRWLASWGDRPQLWDLTTSSSSRRQRTVQTLDIEIDNLQFAPNGRYVALWEGEDIRLWDIEVEEMVGTMPEHDGGIQSLDFSPNNERAISINSRGQARLWNIAPDGAVTLRIWFNNAVDRVYMSPDSTSVAVARHDFMTRFFDIERGQNRGNYDISPNAIFSPDWSIIATSSNNLITWHGLNATTREFDNRPFAFTSQVANVRPTPSTEFARVGVFPQDTPIFAVGKNEDGEWLLIWLPDGTQGWINVVTLRDMERLSLLPTVEVESEADEASDSDDG